LKNPFPIALNIAHIPNRPGNAKFASQQPYPVRKIISVLICMPAVFTEAGNAVANELLKKLDIPHDRLIAGSYLDLLVERNKLINGR
jgi:hypothetical protein